MREACIDCFTIDLVVVKIEHRFGISRRVSLVYIFGCVHHSYVAGEKFTRAHRAECSNAGGSINYCNKDAPSGFVYDVSILGMKAADM